MSPLALVFLALIALLFAFLTYVARKPNEFRIERSQRICASADTVFARVEDLREFNSWNPFALADPDIKIAYSGNSRGTGAAYESDSAGKAGKGRLTVVESQAPAKVVMRLEFMKPFAASNTAVFSIAGDRPVTNVTWTMTGCSSFIHKLCGTFFNMDKMVGGEFAKGLRNLQTLGETSPAKA